MRIVQIITRSDAVGGAHIHLLELCKRLVRDGHEVTVLVGGQGPFVRELSASGIPHQSLRHLVRPIRPWIDIRAIWEVRGALESLEPDLVATHSSKAGWVGRIAAWSLGLPTIFTAHGWAFTEGIPELQRRMYLVAERFAARFTTRIITVSEFDRVLALDSAVGSERRLVTVHNGMSDVAEHLLADPSQSPPHIVMVARFEPQKDQGTLLRALAKTRDLPWSLDFIGDGPLRPEIEQLAVSLGLTDRVRFLGTRKDVAELLAQAQLLALTSRWEGFPLTVLEGMRAGLPVIASDVGGVREAVEEGVNGLLVPREDVDTLAIKLRKLLTDPELRQRMGREGRQRYESRFTFEQMYNKTLQVYQEALEVR